MYEISKVNEDTVSAPTRPHSEPQTPASKPASQDAANIATDAVKPVATPLAVRPKHVAPEQLTGAQSVIRSLEELDVEVIFGIPGGAVLPVYDPLFDSKKLRHVLVRHEQGAGHAASGYAHATGKVGVCMATSGPGATNLVPPLADEPRKAPPENRFGLYYDAELQRPKISLLLVTSFAGGALSPAERHELTTRGIGIQGQATNRERLSP